jgi:hypothetical protein
MNYVVKQRRSKKIMYLIHSEMWERQMRYVIAWLTSGQECIRVEKIK